ncbi:hypothetical protein BGZ83_003369, partial [Gryganskiella cystojenkinii]
SIAFGSSTELSQQQSDVYRAEYHPGTTGTATPDGSSTVAGSPANSDQLVYTTAPMDPNTVPSPVYNNNAYNVPVMQNPASISTSVSAFVPPPPSPSSVPNDQQLATAAPGFENVSDSTQEANYV